MRQISTPSYWPHSYWQENVVKDIWRTALENRHTGLFIVNPNSGPGAEAAHDWVTQSRIIEEYGKKAIGYVSTNYADKGPAREKGTRNKAVILKEIQNYLDWYSISGIFLDEVSNGWNDEQSKDHEFYADLVKDIRAKHPDLLLVGNCGAVPRDQYLDYFDVVVTYEQSAERYLKEAPSNIHPRGFRKHGGEKFWHMIHDVTSPRQAEEILARAAHFGVHHVYLTTDSNYHEPPALWGNPYDTPPVPWLTALMGQWAEGKLAREFDAEAFTPTVNPERGQYRWEGFGSGMGQPKDFPTLDTYRRYDWVDLEPSKGVYDFSQIDADLERVAGEGGLFAFRVMPLNMNRSKSASAIPAYLESQAWTYNIYDKDWVIPDWNSAEYISAWRGLNAALAAKYDGDPRISYIDISGIGHYGEGHDHPYSSGYPGPKGQVSTTKRSALEITKAQTDVFKKTTLIWNLTTFMYSASGQHLENDSDQLLRDVMKLSRNIGLRYDCIGGGPTKRGAWLLLDRAHEKGLADKDSKEVLPKERWRYAPFVSEWCANVTPQAERPADSLDYGTFAEGLRQIEEYHISRTSSHNYKYSWQGAMEKKFSDQEVMDFVAAAVKAGYDYEVQVEPAPNGITFLWHNRGSAPIYRECEITYTIDGEEVKGNTDLREVLPGGGYVREYIRIAPGHHSASVRVRVPSIERDLVLRRTVQDELVLSSTVLPESAPVLFDGEKLTVGGPSTWR